MQNKETEIRKQNSKVWNKKNLRGKKSQSYRRNTQRVKQRSKETNMKKMKKINEIIINKQANKHMKTNKLKR